jgi:hypothetical protein
VVAEGPRFFEGTGEIVLENGEVAVSAAGKYMKVPFDKITDSVMGDLDWFLHRDGNDPEEVEIPEKK